MNVAKMLAGGLLGGLLGAAVWAAIGYFTGYEIGWIAWGIGALAGLGVRLVGSRETSRFDRNLKRMVRERSAPVGPLAGVVAAIAAVASVFAGKYLVVHLFLSASTVVPQDFADDETMIAYLANDIAREHQDEGREVAWPPGVPPFEAIAPEEFPREIWSAAQMRWNGMSFEDKKAYAERRGETLGEAVASVQGAKIAALMGSVSLFDLLWFGLAAVTAFKIGASAGS